MSPPRARALALALALLLTACGGDSTPVGAVKLFLKLSNNLNTEQQMFDLLAKDTRDRMGRKAKQASDHIGGHMDRIQPREMFMLGLANPASKLGAVELQRKDGDRAWVKISDRKVDSAGNALHIEVWELVKEEGGWRIILPKR